MDSMKNVEEEISADVVGNSIETCRRRIQTLQKKLTTDLDSEERSELQTHLRRLRLVLEKQENAFEDLRTERVRDPLTTAIIVILLVLVLIYFIIMLVMQALLPDNK